MNFKFLLVLSAAIIGFGCQGCGGDAVYRHPDLPVKEVAFTQVSIDDNFWAPRIEVNRRVSIPTAFK